QHEGYLGTDRNNEQWPQWIERAPDPLTRRNRIPNLESSASKTVTLPPAHRGSQE
ncbi:hypothetical protein AVEN_137052-1, partial [Araneus ventricosus]